MKKNIFVSSPYNVFNAVIRKKGNSTLVSDKVAIMIKRIILIIHYSTKKKIPLKNNVFIKCFKILSKPLFN